LTISFIAPVKKEKRGGWSLSLSREADPKGREKIRAARHPQPPPIRLGEEGMMLSDPPTVNATILEKKGKGKGKLGSKTSIGPRVDG